MLTHYKGTSIKDVPNFQAHLDPPTIPSPTLSHFHVPTQKRMSQFDNIPLPIPIFLVLMGTVTIALFMWFCEAH